MSEVTSEHAVAETDVAGAPRRRTHTRVKEGMTQPHNWFQLSKFVAVGASGYVVNMAVYAIAHIVFDVHYLAAAVIAFVFAVTNNFLWNRHWTFKATHGHAGFQAARFFTVSLVALGFNLLMLEVLVTAGVQEIPAQAVAIVLVTPINFLGNKLWSFKVDEPV
jgi:putative flippase GtrA